MPDEYVFQRHVDEAFQLGERHDAVEASPNLGVSEAEQRGVQEDVLAPRQLRAESAPEFEQRS